MIGRNQHAVVVRTGMATAFFWSGVLSAAPPAGSRPTGRAVSLFRPGVAIQWTERQVEIDAIVVLREGPLELFACTPRTKEHESILRVDARAADIYAALGLIGLTPGRPMQWDRRTNRYIPPAGDAVDVLVRWQQHGEETLRFAHELMRQTDGTPLDDLVWVFAGSYREPSDAFAADLDGVVVAVVNFPSAVLSLSQSRTDDNAELWVEARTEAIPPVKTPARLILRPAAVRLRLDAEGTVVVDGQPAGRGAIEAALRQRLAHDSASRVRITVDPATPTVRLDMLRRQVLSAGVRPDFVEIRRSTNTAVSRPASRPAD